MINNLITEHLDLWSSSYRTKSTAGRGKSSKLELHGIKKLRALILELAVRGKLVPQSAGDEPASVLLEKIAAEKAQLVKGKKIKRQKPLPEVTDEEKPFELPVGWEIVRLGNLTSKLGSGSTPRGGKNAYVEEGVLFLRSQNIWNDGISLKDAAYIPNEIHEKMDNTQVMPNDVLLNITGASLGRSTIFPDGLKEANVSQHVTIIRLIESKMAKFVHLGILSPLVQRLVWGRQVGMAIEGLSKKVLELFEFPVPPLEEQKRIVIKVDELMKLCDELEQEQTHNIAAHQTLVDVLLTTLTNSKNAQELSDNWALVSEHFDTLFTTKDSVDQLKQTILQLAVMGRLVPQHPQDEPASVLLERIAAEKAKLVKEKKIKRQKPLPAITDKEKPFELPDGWAWTRLGSYSHIFSGNSFKSSDFQNTPGVRAIKITNAGVGKLLHTDDYLPASFLDDFKSFVVQKDDLVLALTRPYISSGLKVSMCSDEYDNALLNQRVAAIRVFGSPMYAFLFLRSPYVLNLYRNRFSGSGLQPNLKVSDVTDLVIAIPAQDEQTRIVTQVNKLMTLCDHLKETIQQTQTTQQHLTDAIVEQALIPEES